MLSRKEASLRVVSSVGVWGVCVRAAGVRKQGGGRGLATVLVFQKRTNEATQISVGDAIKLVQNSAL